MRRKRTRTLLTWLDAFMASSAHAFIEGWGKVERAYKRPFSWIALRLRFAFYPLLALGAVSWLVYDWTGPRSLDSAEDAVFDQVIKRRPVEPAASKRVIVVVEEVVAEDVIRADPNRTIIPGMIVNAVVNEAWGAHPSYAQGYYDRDNDFYVAWDETSRDPAKLQAYLDEWVFGVSDRTEYLLKQPELVTRLKAWRAMSGEVSYGH